MPDREVQVGGESIVDVNYAGAYHETNNLIRRTIYQADELSDEIKRDLDEVRGSKTLKNRYGYITDLASSAAGLLSTKIAAIRELDNNITQVNKLELDRLKTLKADKSNENDDMRMMDLYSAFVNTPIGTYMPNTPPSVQDLNVGVNGENPAVNAVEMVNPSQQQGINLTPEQNRMRMESNPNIQIVVRYNQNTGQRYFDVIDKSTMMSIPNYPRPDGFLLEDTTIDVHSGIARNRNINAVWPLLLEGSNAMPITEY